ncbi:hypothetical protein D3C86_1761860 [compost metagenome]
MNALTGYATRNSTCSGCQRTPGATTDGVTQETTQHGTANCANHVVVVATLDLNRANVNNSTVSDVLNLFGFGGGVNVTRKGVVVHAASQS